MLGPAYIKYYIWHQLDQFGSEEAAGYPPRWLPSIVTFAKQAVEGFEMPWILNPVERLMGEVSKEVQGSVDALDNGGS